MNLKNNTHSKGVGYILWLIGFTGAHRFYFGRPMSGIIWFFTLGLFGVGWLIDLFLISKMDREADNHYAEGRFNYTLIWILLAFTGYLGLHKLALGKPVLALIYFLTAGICGLGWLWDLVHLNEEIDQANRDLTWAK